MAKVCHIISGYYRDDMRVFRRQCLSLHNNNHEVVLLTNDGESEEIFHGISIKVCKKFWRSRLKVILFARWQFLNEALDIDADIYQLHSPELFTIIKGLKNNGKKVIYDAHEDLPRHIEEKDWIPFFLRKLLAKLADLYQRHALRRADAIISPHAHVIQDLSNISTEIKEITNFPLVSSELNFSIEEFKKRENIACYAGTVYPYSNQENTIKAIKSIQNAKYKVAGHIDQDYLNSLRKEPFEDNISFMGRLDRNNLKNLLYSSVVGLCVYDYKKNLGNKLGSFATNKLFEYMEAGLPVICTDYKIWKEVVEGHNCGICIEPGNYHELLEAINYIFSNKDESFRMGQRGKKAINDKYNWKTEEDKYLSLVKKIL